ncbi:hypothetical protein ACHQM5_029267 [Ranunculus cassubicifolius]
MATLKSSSRYNSRSSQISDPFSSSSSEFKTKMSNSSKPLIKTKSSDLATGSKHQNLSSMVKKFIENKSNPKPTSLFIPEPDLIIAQKKKTFPSFHRKLFQKENKPPLALTEVKSNTSERELLNQNRDFQSQITELNLLLDDKNTEVEKLKDLWR